MQDLITSGIPAATGNLSDEAELALLSQTQTSLSLTAALGNFLALADGAVHAVIDPQTGKAYLADTTEFTSLLSVTDAINISPDSGQEGRSLAWTSTPDNSPPATAIDAVAAIVAAAKPRRSVESLIGAALSAVGALEDVEDVPLVVVNQSTGMVQLAFLDAGRAAAVSALDSETPATGNYAKVTVTPPTPETGPDPLVWEGGSTGE